MAKNRCRRRFERLLPFRLLEFYTDRQDGRSIEAITQGIPATEVINMSAERKCGRIGCSGKELSSTRSRFHNIIITIKRQDQS